MREERRAKREEREERKMPLQDFTPTDTCGRITYPCADSPSAMVQRLQHND